MNTETLINNNGVMIDYNCYGNGNHTLLLVHGWCMDQNYWTHQIDSLKEKYTVITMDLPGYGKSGTNREQYTVEAYSNDINCLIEQLELKNVILVGHSMGGDMVLEAALKNEAVIALIGVDNFKTIGLEPSEEMKAQMGGFLQGLQANFAETSVGYANAMLFSPSTPEDVKAKVIADFENTDPSVGFGSLQQLFAYLPTETAQVSKLKKKLHLINSDVVPTHTAGLDATGVDYELHTIAGTGHYPMLEKPQEFEDILHSVIEKITGA